MKRPSRSLIIIFLAVVVITFGLYFLFEYLYHHGGSIENPLPPKPASSTRQTPITTSTDIQHIFIIVEENKPYENIVGSSSAPYLNSLIKKYALATNYYGVAHPSLPNYLALTSGSTNGFTSDCNPPSSGCILNVSNIADEIEHSGRSWREYADSMPSPCYMFNFGEYATKHNPFVYYDDIESNKARCDSHVVPYSKIYTDLKSVNSTPSFAFITPNLCNDMHDCSVAIGDDWLKSNVSKILDSPAFTTQRSLLVITWDEGDVADNHIPTIFIGSAAKSGYKSAVNYNHYSLLRTIESVWNLKPLTANDKSVAPMTSMLND